jgi:hypothetical protein
MYYYHTQSIVGNITTNLFETFTNANRKVQIESHIGQGRKKENLEEIWKTEFVTTSSNFFFSLDFEILILETKHLIDDILLNIFILEGVDDEINFRHFRFEGNLNAVIGS